MLHPAHRILTLQKYLTSQGREGFRKSYLLLLAASFLITFKIGLISQARALYLNELGMSLSLFGLLTSIGWGLLFFSQSIVGRISDLLGNRKRLTMLFSIIDIVILFGFLVTRDIRLLAVLLVLETVTHSQIFRLLMTMMGDVSNAANYGATFGLYKAMGSAAWMCAMVIAGFAFQTLGFPILVVASILVMIAILILASTLREPAREAESDTEKKPGLRGIFSYAFLAICVLQLLIAFQDKAGIAYFFLFMTREMLLPASFAGIIMAVAGLYEIPLTIFGGKILDRFNPRLLISLGCLIGVFRWILLPFISNPWLLFLIQIQHAVIITSIFVGIPSYIARTTDPRSRGTAFGIIGSIESVGATAGPATIGHLSDSLGMGRAMIINGSIGLTGVTAFMLIVTLPRLLAGIRKKHKTGEGNEHTKLEH